MTTKIRLSANLTLTRYIVIAYALLSSTLTYAVDIRVVSSGGFASAYKKLAPEFEKKTGNSLIFSRGLSNGTDINSIPMRLERNEDIDVVMMTGKSLDEMMAQGKLLPNSKVLFANSVIACAVKQGEPTLDISTVDKLRNALLSIKTMAYSNGASGEYIKNSLMMKLGIKEQMAGKLVQTLAIPVGEVVASGDTQIGCQQLSELKEIKGIEIIGPLPQEAQLITPLFGAVVAKSKVPMQAKDLLLFLSSPTSAWAIEETGLISISKGN